MSPHFSSPLLNKKAMDALLDTMAEADYESLGAHRRGEPYEPEQKGTERETAWDITIPSKDMHPPSSPEDATFFKESDPQFEMSASGVRRVVAKGTSAEWEQIQAFLSGRDYKWLGRVSDGTEMWGKKNERLIWNPAAGTWEHRVGTVADLTGTIGDLEQKMAAYGFDQATPKTSALKSCVACETDWCIEHGGLPEVEVKEHEFFKESEPLKTADSETRSYGMDQPLGGSDNPTGGSDEINADTDENAGLGGVDLTSSLKTAEPMAIGLPQFQSWWEQLRNAGAAAVKNFSVEQTPGVGPFGPAVQINYKGQALGYIGFPLKELEGIIGPITRWIEGGEELSDPDPYEMEYPKAASMFTSPLLKKALVDIHETPTMLPPRQDMRRHLDQDEADEAMVGVMDGVAPQPRKPARQQQIDPNIHIGAAKIRWRVSPAPTGQYRSFERRGWPSAEYANGDAAVRIECADDYVPSQVREGRHAPLSVYVADWSGTPEEKAKRGGFVWRKAKGTFATLKEAQAAAATIIEGHPEIHPAKAATPETPKQADFDQQLDEENEYFLDQVRDAKNEAKRHFMEEDYLQQVADEYIPPISMEELWKIMGEEYTAEFYGYPYSRVEDFTDQEQGGWEGTRKPNDGQGNAGRFASSRRCPLCKSANTRKVDDDRKGYRSGLVLAECRDCDGFYTTSAH